MTNLDRYNKVFEEIFNICLTEYNFNIEINSISKWDSIGHINLIIGLETTFNINICENDIYKIKSYELGKKILNNYGITF